MGTVSRCGMRSSRTVDWIEKKERKEMDISCHVGKQEEVRQAKIELNQDISDTFRKDKYKKDQKELKERLYEDKNR